MLWAWVAGCDRVEDNTSSRPKLSVTASDRLAVVLGGQTFHLEYAMTDAVRTVGLSGRSALASDGGMLFVFPDIKRRYFWMKDCLIDLDIIFLDTVGRIVQIHAMALPEARATDDQLMHYSSRWPAQFAIELAGGAAARLGLKTGQKIDLPLDQLKQQVR